MLAVFGYGAQAILTGVGPFQNLKDHLAGVLPISTLCSILWCGTYSVVTVTSSSHCCTEASTHLICCAVLSCRPLRPQHSDKLVIRGGRQLSTQHRCLVGVTEVWRRMGVVTLFGKGVGIRLWGGWRIS